MKSRIVQLMHRWVQYETESRYFEAVAMGRTDYSVKVYDQIKTLVEFGLRCNPEYPYRSVYAYISEHIGNPKRDIRRFCSTLPSAIKRQMKAPIQQTPSAEVCEERVAEYFATTRGPLVFLLGQIKDERAIPVLISLLDDKGSAGGCFRALGSYKRLELRPYFERFQNHSDEWIRNNAKGALKKLQAKEARDK